MTLGGPISFNKTKERRPGQATALHCTLHSDRHQQRLLDTRTSAFYGGGGLHFVTRTKFCCFVFLIGPIIKHHIDFYSLDVNLTFFSSCESASARSPDYYDPIFGGLFWLPGCLTWWRRHKVLLFTLVLCYVMTPSSPGTSPANSFPLYSRHRAGVTMWASAVIL